MISNRPLHWDIFCQVIDNFGDVGVCWRAAAELAARGQQVRLWLDDASALAWMAPAPHPEGLSVHPWPDSAARLPADGAGDVLDLGIAHAALVEECASRVKDFARTLRPALHDGHDLDPICWVNGHCGRVAARRRTP